MLVITRSSQNLVKNKYAHQLVVMTSDGPITVGISKIDMNRARLSIDAPPICKVYRRELLDEHLRPLPQAEEAIRSKSLADKLPQRSPAARPGS